MFKKGIFCKDYECETLYNIHGELKIYTEKCHWESETTGELLPDLYSVIKTAMIDLFRYHTINVNWKYLENGI